MKKFVIVFFLLLSTLSTFAHDFVAVNSDGVTIYYKKTSSTEVAVTYKGSSYYNDDYHGVINIPLTVSYNGATYSVTSIGSYAFNSCYSMTSVNIPESVTSIYNYAFNGCNGLTSVNIPNSVIYIGNSVFGSCSNLNAFYGKFASDDNRCLIVDGVLNSFAPAGLTSYVIPNSVSAIGNNVFNSCKYLTSIIIPGSVTSIGDFVFWYCQSLKSITIPKSVTYIGSDAFYYCSNLQSIKVENPQPKEIRLEYDAFKSVSKTTCNLYVPMGSKALYAAADKWNEFKNIIEYEAVMGDLDGDNKLSIADVVIGCNLILSSDYNKAVDFNNDGNITIADIVLLCNEILSVKD